MDNSNSIQKKSHVAETANKLLNDGKKLGNELYDEGVYKAKEVEIAASEYSDELLLKVRENTLTSVLIAGGIGFLLSTLLKK